MYPILFGIILLVVTGFFFTQKEPKGESFNSDVKGAISITDETPAPSPSPSPSNSPVAFSTPNPTQTSAPINDSYQYPNSQKEDNNTYTSYDSTDTITNWYKDKVKSLGLKVSSFVNTKSNDNVLNKLNATNGNNSISIEISKPSGSNQVKIKVITS